MSLSNETGPWSNEQQQRGWCLSWIIIILGNWYWVGLQGPVSVCEDEDLTTQWQSQNKKWDQWRGRYIRTHRGLKRNEHAAVQDVLLIRIPQVAQATLAVLTLLALRIWNMRGRPCVMSSSVYSSSSMQLNSFRRPWISGRRCWWKHVRRDSSHVCRVQGTPVNLSQK